MAKLTVKELLELKGVRQIAFVQVAQAEEAIAASAAGMDMVGTGFRLETREFANLVPQTHFLFGLARGRNSGRQISVTVAPVTWREAAFVAGQRRGYWLP